MKRLLSMAAAAGLLVIWSTSCARQPRRVPEIIAVTVAALPASPEDRAWRSAPEHLAKLLPQDLVEPRLMTPSTPELLVRSLTDGSRIAFRLEWPDADQSDTPGPAQMVDACAVQIPEKIEINPPDPQMGQAGKMVQVTYWRADWQAIVNGRGDTIRDLYPNASIDHYPFEAKALEPGSPEQKEMAQRYAPALVLGNLRAGPRATPVEDLVASGPATLAPGPSLASAGKGVFGKKGWSVVISRKLPEGLTVNQRTHVALAVWQGALQEAGARKMRTGWIPLVVRSAK